MILHNDKSKFWHTTHDLDQNDPTIILTSPVQYLKKFIFTPNLQIDIFFLTLSSHKVGNTITMVVDTFRFTETNFLPIPTHDEGLIPVSDTVLAYLQGSQVTSDIKKSVWDKSLVTRDRAWTHISELSQGSLGTKIALKTTLEAVISTRNERVASEVFRWHW